MANLRTSGVQRKVDRGEAKLICLWVEKVSPCVMQILQSNYAKIDLIRLVVMCLTINRL